MDKYDVLRKVFRKENFRDIQEQAIDAITEGERVLCLMSTGSGKSLIYQIASVLSGKTTIIISPLVALMMQQCDDMQRLNISAVNFSGMDSIEQFEVIRSFRNGLMPQFIFMSPERIANDGFLEYVLSSRRSEIGLVVVDEVHCISQWGAEFRPAYRSIPEFLSRVFVDRWPALLCLTATLNPEEQAQVQRDFRVTKTMVGTTLWRQNLRLEIINLRSGKEDNKDAELERLITKHSGQKILVFVHRKYGKHGTTRTLYERYKDAFAGVAYYDSDLSEQQKRKVLEDFSTGSLRIVFATSAFGMGVDIQDIRVVINYLISETIEQYYQEVGRAGRDGELAYGYLLFTNQSKKGRLMLMRSTLCSPRDVATEYEERKMKPGESFKHISYDSLTDEQRIAFAFLLDYGVFSVIAKGIQNTNCFSPKTAEGKAFLNNLLAASSTGLTKIISKKTGQSIHMLMVDIWKMYLDGHIKLCKAPAKTIFYREGKPLDADLLNEIANDQDAKKNKRTEAFERFAEGIETGLTAEQMIKSALKI